LVYAGPGVCFRSWSGALSIASFLTSHKTVEHLPLNDKPKNCEVFDHFSEENMTTVSNNSRSTEKPLKHFHPMSQTAKAVKQNTPILKGIALKSGA